MRGRGAALAASALAVLALAGGEAGAAVSCGKVITKDLKLRKDLKNCPGDGLLIDASGITIDLNGHKISGQGAAGTEGVGLAGPFVRENVVIKGPGRIARFDEGVSLTSCENSRVKRVTVKQADTAIRVGTCDDAKVRNNKTRGVGIRGVSVGNSERAEVSGNLVNAPAQLAFNTIGISVNGSTSPEALVEDNVVEGNGVATFGIQVNGSAPGATFKRNVVRGFIQYGIGVYDGSTSTLVKKNTAAGSDGYGIFVQSSAGAGTKVVKNVARRNGLDGIRLDQAAEVGKNTAVNNGQWGIYAAVAGTDLGGNKASGNGAGQCFGVACS